jgi:hypothetical protein
MVLLALLLAQAQSPQLAQRRLAAREEVAEQVQLLMPVV